MARYEDPSVFLKLLMSIVLCGPILGGLVAGIYYLAYKYQLHTSIEYFLLGLCLFVSFLSLTELQLFRKVHQIINAPVNVLPKII